MSACEIHGPYCEGEAVEVSTPVPTCDVKYELLDHRLLFRGGVEAIPLQQAVAAIDEAIERCAAIAQAESDNHIDRAEACDCAEKIRALKSPAESPHAR